MYVIFNLIATLYCGIWDYYMDWGLWRSKKKGHYGLRDQMIYPQWFYYYAICTNAIIRFFWVLNIFAFPFTTSKDGEYVMERLEIMVFIGMIAEAYRRSQWSLLRVENEFYNNFEAYRSIPAIPTLMDDQDVSKN